MPFASKRRHEFWTSDIRYIDHALPSKGNFYVISILENHSRAILASAITRAQDTTAFLSVLYEAVRHYGSPEALVTDGGGVFKANRAMAVYEALGIEKGEIVRGKPWQSYLQTTFNTEWRISTSRKPRADPNAHKHTHVGSPTTTRRSTGRTASAPTAAARRRRYSGGSPAYATATKTSIVVHQPKLFDLAASLGEDGWLKAIRMADYAPRTPKRPDLLQQVLFAYTEAI